MNALRSEILQRNLSTAAIIFSLILLWSLTHHYRGLAGDAELYAFQALAKTNTTLANDLYLQNVSQDAFTVFSAFYAWCIGFLGISTAALALLILSKLGVLAAAWSLARNLYDGSNALLCVSLLIITVGSYGAYGVFQYLEDYLTARSCAEALVVTSFAFYLHGHRGVGLLIAAGALFIHPLMALPGLLLLLGLSTLPKFAMLGAAAGILAAIGISVAGQWVPSTAGLLTNMDPDWLNVVKERSQFLFLQLWAADDWKIAARPFLTLTLCTLVSNDRRVRGLSMTAMLVGASGLAVALISSLLGPVAVLLQGQAWRWVWVTGFVSVLLLGPTAIRAWNDDTTGPLSAVLLIAGWTIPAPEGSLCTALALASWLLRGFVTHRIARQIRWISVATGIAICAWVIADSWKTLIAPLQVAGSPTPWPISIIRNFMELGTVSIFVVGCLVYGIRISRSLLVEATCWLIIFIVAAFAFPESIRNIHLNKLGAAGLEFTEWRSAIPEGSNVLVLPSPTSAGFAWFTLERPSFLSLNQSSGVVFSRETSLEVRRRAEEVLPVWDQSWQLRSRGRMPHHGLSDGEIRPLTRETLVAICRDPNLAFVVSRENVGYDSLQHTQDGAWKNWNLYDCRHVQSEAPHA